MFRKRELRESKLKKSGTTTTTTTSRRCRPRAQSPALLVALLALFLSLGGTALASLIITSNSQVAAHTIAGAKAGSGVNQNVIPGSLAGSDLANGTLTGTQIATGYKDGLATTPSLRTLGTGADQAAAGDDPRLSEGVLGAREDCPSTDCELQGPLPITFYFDKRAINSFLLTWSGTGYRTPSQGIGVGSIELSVNGTQYDMSSLYFNQLDLHLAFPSVESVVTGLLSGVQTITLTGGGFGALTTDSTDFFHITVEEVNCPASTYC
jgi:hypothetical protein